MPRDRYTLFKKTNDQLKKLFKGYKLFLLDKGLNKGGITTLKKSGENPVEIDAIALKKNIVLLINVYSGRNSEKINNKIKPFFRNLRYLEDLSKLDFSFKISNLKSSEGKRNKKICDQIRAYIREKNKKDFSIILRKIAFCPNIKVHLNQIGSLKEDDIIIDSGHYKCFDYIIDNIGYGYLNNELSYFLKLKMVDIDRKKTSRYSLTPLLTRGVECVDLILEENEKEMYSACVSVEDIMGLVHVFRSAEYYNKDTFQRMVNGGRLRKISNKYLENNLSFPNNIIIALNPKYYNLGNKKEWKVGKEIKFIKEFGSLIIIDGQHRIFAHLIDEERDIKKKILVNLIFFRDKEIAFNNMREMFYVINTEQQGLSSAIALKILSVKDPYILRSIFYKIFEELNHIKSHCLFEKIEFEEKELREGVEKLHISSILKYGGLNQIAKGVGKKAMGFERFKGDSQDNFSFYKLLFSNYFKIVDGVISIDDLNPLVMGGLMRLTRQFLNDKRTKDAILNVCKTGEIDPDSETIIEDYLRTIPFSRLDELEYGRNKWAVMEGFFVGCIRKDYPRFGAASVFNDEAKKAINKAKKF